MSILHPEPCSPGSGGGGRDVELLLLCDYVDDVVVGSALAVYEYDSDGNPVGPPTFVDPITGAPYVVQGTLQPCSSGGGGEVVVTNQVEVKNDIGNPLAVSGEVSLDAATLAALETINALVSGTIALDAPTLAALENIVVSGTVALDAPTLAALESITAVVSGEVELGATTLAALENITVTVSNEVEIKNDSGNPVPVTGALTVSGEVEVKNDSGNPIPVTGTVALDALTLAALETINAIVSGTVALDGPTLAALETITAIVNQGQTLDTNNSEIIDSTDASPGTPWVGAWTQTRDAQIVAVRTVLAASDPTISGTFTFEFSETGTEGPLGIAPITESRTIEDFIEVAEAGLDNFGAYYRVAFEPDAPLGTEEVYVTTQLYRQPAQPFARLANQETQEANMTAPNIFAYGKAFDPTGKSVNLRAGGHDPDNSYSNNPFAAAGTFTGPYKPSAGLNSMLAFIITDQPLATARIDWSPDGVNPSPGLLSSSDMLGSVQVFENIPVIGTIYIYLITVTTMLDRYYRLRVVNGATPTVFYSEGDVFVYDAPFGGSYGSLSQQLSNLSTALLTRAVGAGYSPDETFVNLRAQGSHAANSTDVPLAAADTWRGEWFPWQSHYIKLIVDLESDVDGTLYIDFSEATAPTDGDESSVDDYIPIAYDHLVEPLLKRHTPVQSKWVRLRYVNGSAGQTDFQLDCAFVTSDPGVPMQALTHLPRKLGQAGTVRAVVAVENAAGDGYQEWPTDVDGIPEVHVTELDGDLFLGGLPTKQTRQFTVGPTPVQLDVTKLPNRRFAVVHSKDATNEVHVGESADIGPDLDTYPVWPKTAKGGAYGPDVDIWACTSGGGMETTTNLAGSSATGTAGTNPTNALTSNDVDATLDALTEFVNVTGFAAGTTNALVSVKIGIEAAKQASQFETVTWQETKSGATSGAGTVSTSASLAGGSEQFYLATITRNDNAGSVTSVSGLGLTWTALQTNVTSGNRRIDVWYAKGTATAGTVSATLSNSTNAHIGVGRYTNVDQTTPVQDSSTATGTGTAVTGPALAGTNKGYSILSVSHLSASGTPGAGYTERLDASNGSGSNTDSIYTENKALVATGSETATATLVASSAWAAIGVTLTPRAAIDPVVRMSYEYNNIAGATTSDVTLSSTVDVTTLIDVTTDRAWTYADIALMEVIGTAQVMGSSAALIDRLFVQITDTSATTVRIALEEIA